MRVMTDSEYEEVRKARREFWSVVGSFALRFGALIAVLYLGMAFMVGGGTLQCTFY